MRRRAETHSKRKSGGAMARTPPRAHVRQRARAFSLSCSSTTSLRATLASIQTCFFRNSLLPHLAQRFQRGIPRDPGGRHVTLDVLQPAQHRNGLPVIVGRSCADLLEIAEADDRRLGSAVRFQDDSLVAVSDIVRDLREAITRLRQSNALHHYNVAKTGAFRQIGSRAWHARMRVARVPSRACGYRESMHLARGVIGSRLRKVSSAHSLIAL